MAKKRKTKAEKIAERPMEYINKLSGQEGRKELEGYVRQLRSSYKRRVGSFKRNGLVSYAQISFEDSTPPGRKVQLTKMSRNQLLLEYYRYAKFFNDETSSIEGIKRVNRQQDERIFGVNSRGLPKTQMTPEERSRYWRLYDEFKNQFPQWASQPYSEDEQKVLAQAMFGDDGFNKMTFVQKLERMEQLMQERQTLLNLEDVPNVLSGRGPRLKK